MKIFDYSFLKNKKIPTSILSIYLSIEKIQGLGMLNEEMYPNVFENLQRIAKTQSVTTSNAIDGAFVSNNKTKLLLENNKLASNNVEEQIISYNEVLNEIHSNSNNHELNEYNIRYFHKTLVSNNGSGYGGEYKNEENLFVETIDDGSSRVVITPVRAEDTSKAMEQLIIAYKDALDDSDIPNLLLIPSVILDFLCIYPFGTGNGKMSRLLSLLLLYKNGYNVGKYVSFEKQIFRSLPEYYEAIRISSLNWKENNNNYYPFIEYFLKSLYSCHHELNSRFNIVGKEKKSKKFRIEETIKLSHHPISRKEIHLVWPDISHETIKKVIKNLLNDQKIKKIGNYKDARYKRNWYGETKENDESIVIF